MRSKDLPYHFASKAVTPSPPALVLIGKYEVSLSVWIKAHEAISATSTVFIGFVHE
ncbi:MAG TPA: hypothetical protein VJN21_06150 [Candidatus Acidoferrales bacterium]|nr:hypothetical protein [Candidatus Acidoferrales bacterium]